MITLRRSFWILWLLVVAAAGPLRPALAEDLPEALALQLNSGVAAAGTDEEIQTLTVLDRFYRERDYRPLWVLETSSGPRAQELSGLLIAADLDGLDPSDYHVEEVTALVAAVQPENLARLEVLLSLGLVRYAADLGQGASR